MLLAVILFDFDPSFRIGGLVARWQTLGIAAAILLAMVIAALVAGRLRPRTELYRGPDAAALLRRLSRVDLIYIVAGAAPGALAGGRLGYVLAHLDFYRAHASDILDVTQGSLSLSLAVVGGIFTGAMVTRLFGAPLGRWLHVAAIPLLLAIAFGKLALMAGGS